MLELPPTAPRLLSGWALVAREEAEDVWLDMNRSDMTRMRLGY